MHRRYAAIDFGDRRTGVAIGDTETGIASPVAVIERSIEQGLIPALVKLLRDEAPHGLIIGLPINMDGTEGPQASKARTIGQQLHAALVRAGLTSTELFFHDERLTSAQADWEMAQSGLTHKQKKARRDAIAAAATLRDWMAIQHPRHHPE